MAGRRAKGRDHITTYRVYGTSITTSHRFAVPVPVAAGPGELRFEVTGAPPPGDADWAAASVVDVQGVRADGRSDFVFARLADRDVIRITGALEFHLWPDRIVCHVLDPRHAHLVDIGLFGMVLALWLEQRGVTVLHASAVVVDGRAVGFLASGGAGKTSTAAAFLAAGHELLTEDLLALDEAGAEIEGRPGYPMLRLWPEQAERFAGAGWADLPRARPDVSKRRVPVAALTTGRFRDGPAPLRRLYLPARGDAPGAGVAIERVPPQEAVVALVRHSFLPREVHLWGLQPARLAVFARLAATVPVAHLRYPSGYDRLGEVIDAVAADLDG